MGINSSRPFLEAFNVVRLPPRRRAAIFVCADGHGAWLTLAGAHGWIFGSRADAIAEARWLSRNYGLPVLWEVVP
jgi:hypothetical protein